MPHLTSIRRFSRTSPPEGALEGALDRPVRSAFLGVALAAATATSALDRPVRGDVLHLESLNSQTSGYFGQSLAIVDDLDGDGSDDVLIGAPLENAVGTTSSGRAYVYSGLTGTLIRIHVSAFAQNYGSFGWAVAGLGDVDGDGRGDYAVGAPLEGGNDIGQVFVYSGATGSILWDKVGPGLATGWGGALAVVGDLNNDGKAELMVGHMGVTGDAPAVSVYEGKNGAILMSYPKPAGGGAFHKFGQAVSGVPDLTGDGKADVLVGAPGWDLTGLTDTGAVFVFNGVTGGFIGALSSIDAQSSGLFGRSVAGVPDLDGDGKGDIVVGAPIEMRDGSSTHEGQVHVYSGATRAYKRTLNSFLPTDQGIFGHVVEAADDLDGDGFGDIVVGAALEGPGPTTGRVYRFSGLTGASLGAPYQSAEPGSGFGMAVSAAGDLTQDGAPDIAVGMPYATTGGFANAGKAFVHRIVANDWCSSLYHVPEVSEGWHYLSTIAAEGSLPIEQPCSSNGETAFEADVFLRYVPAGTGLATFSTCMQAGFDTRLAIYAASESAEFVCDLSDLLGCNDDLPGCPNGGSATTVAVLEGVPYWVRIGGALGDQGIAGLTITLDPSCEGDLDGNGVVNGADLATVLGQWGTSGPADIDGSDVVDGADLALLLGAWGPCPR